MQPSQPAQRGRPVRYVRYVPPSRATRVRRAATVLVIGVVLCAAGLVYIALPASELPLPGHRAGDHAHNLTAGLFALLGALVCLIVGALLAPRRPVDEQPSRLTPRLREEDLPPGSIHVIPGRPLE